jgi:hypothetical protein
LIDYFDWLGILEEGEKVELSKKESSLIIDIEQKRLVGELNKVLTKIDFKKYANSEQITADESHTSSKRYWYVICFVRTPAFFETFDSIFSGTVKDFSKRFFDMRLRSPQL